MRTNQAAVESQFKRSWIRRTACPEVQAVYKIVDTPAGMQEYQVYRYDRLLPILDRLSLLIFLVLGRVWKQGEISHSWARPAEMNTVCGTECEGNATSETKVSPLSARTQSVRCVASSDRHSISSSSGGQLGGGGSVVESILRQLRQSSTPFRELVEDVPDLEVLTPRSDEYSRNIGATSNWKALLLNKVVIGNSKKLINEDPLRTQPPPGFDSVCHLEAALWKC